MVRSLRISRLLGVFAAVGLVLWAGPNAPGSQCCRNATGFPPPGCIPCDECYGYYPTCWRKWSPHCHDCPPVETGLPEAAPLEDVEPPVDEELPSDAPPEMEDLPELEMPPTDEDPPPKLQVDPTDPTLPSDEKMPLEGPDSEPMPGAEKPDPMSDAPPPPPAGTEEPMPLPMPMQTTPDEDSFNAPRQPAEPRKLHSRNDRPPRAQVHSSFQATFRSTVSFRPGAVTLERHADIATRDVPDADNSRAASSRPHERSTHAVPMTRDRANSQPVAQRAMQPMSVRRDEAMIDRRIQEQRQPSLARHSNQFAQQVAASREQRRPSHEPPRPVPMSQHGGLGPNGRGQPALYSAPPEAEAGSVRRAGPLLRQNPATRPEAPRPAPAPTHNGPPRKLDDHQLSSGRPVSRSAEPPRPDSIGGRR